MQGRGAFESEDGMDNQTESPQLSTEVSPVTRKHTGVSAIASSPSALEKQNATDKRSTYRLGAQPDPLQVLKEVYSLMSGGSVYLWSIPGVHLLNA